MAGAGATPQTGTRRINLLLGATSSGSDAKRSFIMRVVPSDADALPDDPAICCSRCCRSCCAENDKLRLLIQRFTRHQFGRRSEQLTADQLQFGLEDQEQTIAEHQAAEDAAEAASGRQPQTARQAAGAQSRRPAIASAALRSGDRRRSCGVPVLWWRHALHRRIAHRAARHRAGATARAGDAAAALCLPQPARRAWWWRRRRNARSMAACRPRR